MTVTQKPLLLKDFLELDPNSDSCNSFISFPRKQTSITVRFLIQAEQCRGAKLLRSRSRNALTKLSTMFGSVTSYSSTRSKIARKLSKRLWSRSSKKDDAKVTVKDIVRLNSFELYGDGDSLFMTSPVVSSCSSCTDGGDCSDSLGSISSGGSECFGGGGACDFEPKKIPVSNDLRYPLDNHEAHSLSSEHTRCQSEEEKEQFSPVSIMDFPDNSEDNNDDEYSNTSPYNLSSIERKTHQLLQKIRRFETLAELEPLDLQFHFSSSDVASDEEYDGIHVPLSDRSVACNLIQRLKIDRQFDPQVEQIILDFFSETMSISLEITSIDIERCIRVAEDWIDGGGCLKREDHGKAQLCDMEKNGRWRSFEDGKDDVAADVEFGILENLLQELVIEISDGSVC